MKKAVIVLLTISMVFILTGFTFAAAGGFKFGFHYAGSYGKYERLPQTETIEKTENAQKCSSIELSLVNTKLEVVKYDGSDVKIDYENIYKNEWSYSFDGSKMILKNDKYHDMSFSSFNDFLDALKKGDFNFDFGIHDDNGDSLMHIVKVYIPSGVSLSYDVSNVNGSINFNAIAAKDLDFSVVNSSITLGDTTSKGNLKIDDVNGTVNMKNVTSPSLDFSSAVNAQCSIDTSQFDEINAKSFVNGALKLTGVSDPEEYSVSYNVVNGSANIGDNSYSKSGNYKGSGASKHSVKFDGVNSSLYITK